VLASNADDRFAADPKDPKKSLIVDRDLGGRDDRAEGAAAGAGVGAAVSGAAGLLTGLGLLAIPGVGPVVAAGWLVATLTDAAARGATGGIIGALTQSGVSKEDADVYAEGLRRGGAVVSARVADADAARLQAVMDRSAVDVRAQAAAYRQSGWNSFSPSAAPLHPRPSDKERDLYR
jgi:hypothetical protein